MDFLPLGSIVLLKEADKKLMIYGIMQYNAQDSNIYDYIGCPYPEGHIDPAHTYMFNHTELDKFVFLGYVDSEYQLFREQIKPEIIKIIESRK